MVTAFLDGAEYEAETLEECHEMMIVDLREDLQVARTVNAELSQRISELETEIAYCPLCENGSAEARRLEIEAKDARIAELEMLHAQQSANVETWKRIAEVQQRDFFSEIEKRDNAIALKDGAIAALKERIDSLYSQLAAIAATDNGTLPDEVDGCQWGGDDEEDSE